MCNCINKYNKVLAEWNTIIETPLQMDFKGKRLVPPKCIIATKKRNASRKPKPEIVATFCPFCGERYPEDD